MSKSSRKRLREQRDQQNGIMPNNILKPKTAIKITEDICPQVVLDAMVKGDSGTINRLINQGSIAF